LLWRSKGTKDFRNTGQAVVVFDSECGDRIVFSYGNVSDRSQQAFRNIYHDPGRASARGGYHDGDIYGGRRNADGYHWHRHDDQVAGAFMLAGGVIGGVIMVAMGFFDLYAASKIRKAAPVGRTLGIVVCALSILSFPLGTALGAYGLWFFFSDQGRALYGSSAIVPVDFDRNAPPPNSWA
jgi:hypothetical protein